MEDSQSLLELLFPDMPSVELVKSKLNSGSIMLNNEELACSHYNMNEFTTEELLKIPHCYICGKKKTHRIAFECMHILKNTYYGLIKWCSNVTRFHDMLFVNKCLIKDGHTCYCEIKKRKSNDIMGICYNIREMGKLTCNKHKKVYTNNESYVETINRDDMIL